jgi:thiamine biosynthesis protein ThiS
MQLKINGELRSVEGVATVSELFTALELDPTRTVVEKNGEIVARDTFAVAPLGEGDVVELVRFVGGG